VSYNSYTSRVFTFGNHEQVEHYEGEEHCPGCMEGYPKHCPTCKVFIHANLEYASRDDYWVASECENCGMHHPEV
jgi:hypothetical protein